ncbi:MAG: hypothetical protein JXR25_08415 [Pontiellaceae bacterium]|nr:hypothetical protein [Pontiellaceae bacterium]MBN2784837.1 hypothetical protein [Pontiellaceae bacterium]
MSKKVKKHTFLRDHKKYDKLGLCNILIMIYGIKPALALTVSLTGILYTRLRETSERMEK